MFHTWSWGVVELRRGERSAVTSPCSLLLGALLALSGCGEATSRPSGAEVDAAAGGSRDAASPSGESSAFTTKEHATETSGAQLPDAGVRSGTSERGASSSTAPSTAPSSLHSSAEAGADEAELDDVECEYGVVACSHDDAYQCVGNRLEPEWELRADVSCPLWAANVCEAAVDALRDAAQPCNVNADCDLWGGYDSKDACEGPWGDYAFSISSLTSEPQRKKWREGFDALVSGGCQYQWGADGAPPEAVCFAGECSYTDNSCFGDWADGFESEPPTDAALDASLEAGSPEAGSLNSGLDAGLDSGTTLPDSSVMHLSTHAHGH